MKNESVENRIAILRAKLKEMDLDAILIKKAENCFYLSGFTGSDAYLLISSNDLIILTDSRYEIQASLESQNFKLLLTGSDLAKDSAKYIRARKFKSLGFIKHEISFLEFEKLSLNLENATKLVPIDDIIAEQRAQKSVSEIELIRKAVAIADSAFENILNYIKPGISENDISLEIEYHMKKNGASGTSFDTIVASGTRSAMPHGTASSRKIENGDTILMDFGAISDNYCSDITRTIFLGNPSDEMRKIYNTVLEAQITAENSAFENMTGKEVDFIARNIIDKAGYKENFGHSLGHGVGLEVHESPRFSPSYDKKMKNGMIVTVEPGIYLRDIGGVRIEDIIVINGRNPEILTKSSKEIIII